MRHDLGERAAALCEYMSELSEAAYCAGWMQDNEYRLWEAVIGGPCRYARLDVGEEEIGRLRSLSEAAGGWIVFDDETEETWVPLAEWLPRFAAWQAAPR